MSVSGRASAGRESCRIAPGRGKLSSQAWKPSSNRPSIRTKAMRALASRAVGPGVAGAALDDDVAGADDRLAVVEDEDELAFEDDAVVDRLGAVHQRVGRVLRQGMAGADRLEQGPHRLARQSGDAAVVGRDVEDPDAGAVPRAAAARCPARPARPRRGRSARGSRGCSRFRGRWCRRRRRGSPPAPAGRPPGRPTVPRRHARSRPGVPLCAIFALPRSASTGWRKSGARLQAAPPPPYLPASPMKLPLLASCWRCSPAPPSPSMKAMARRPRPRRPLPTSGSGESAPPAAALMR